MSHVLPSVKPVLPRVSGTEKKKNVFPLLLVFTSFNMSVASKMIWNRRKIRRYELGLDLVLVLYKAGVV